jgi:hypothetical protein
MREESVERELSPHSKMGSHFPQTDRGGTTRTNATVTLDKQNSKRIMHESKRPSIQRPPKPLVESDFLRTQKTSQIKID